MSRSPLTLGVVSQIPNSQFSQWRVQRTQGQEEGEETCCVLMMTSHVMLLKILVLSFNSACPPSSPPCLLPLSPTSLSSYPPLILLHLFCHNNQSGPDPTCLNAHGCPRVALYHIASQRCAWYISSGPVYYRIVVKNYSCSEYSEDCWHRNVNLGTLFVSLGAGPMTLSFLCDDSNFPSVPLP